MASEPNEYILIDKTIISEFLLYKHYIVFNYSKYILVQNEKLFKNKQPDEIVQWVNPFESSVKMNN